MGPKIVVTNISNVFSQNIIIGIVDEHSVDNPLFQWRDDKKPYDVSIAGLTSEGSAVYYGVDCPILIPREFYPRGHCKSDLDCSDVPNTDCSREPEPEKFPTTTIRLMTCRCADGYEPIPGKIFICGKKFIIYQSKKKLVFKIRICTIEIFF